MFGRWEDQEVVQVLLEQIEDLPAEELEEEEEVKKNAYMVLYILCNLGACQDFTSLDLSKFKSFVMDCSPALDATTYKGTQ